jgi:DNA-binding transcriptional ArsR family regulator
MSNNLELAEIGALVGDPARAAILHALLDGRARTAGELAYFARVSAPTASGHLKRLTESKLLSVISQGRHRYFCIASPLVAQMLESISAVAAIQAPPRTRPIRGLDAAMREARFCYDHLAGRLGVAIADALTSRGLVTLDNEGGEVTPEGFAFLSQLGLDLQGARATRRVFCRPCLDWSERRYHLAGYIGAELARHAFDSHWIARIPDSRAVQVTPAGRRALAERLGVSLNPEAEAA